MCINVVCSVNSADYVWTESWETFEGHSYKFYYDKHSSAHDADRLCRSLGAMLVSLTGFCGQFVHSVVTLSTLWSVCGQTV